MFLTANNAMVKSFQFQIEEPQKDEEKLTQRQLTEAILDLDNATLKTKTNLNLSAKMKISNVMTAFNSIKNGLAKRNRTIAIHVPCGKDKKKN